MWMRILVGLVIGTFFVLHLNYVNPDTEDCGFLCYSWIAILFAIVDGLLSSHLFYSKKENILLPCAFGIAILLPFAMGTAWSMYH